MLLFNFLCLYCLIVLTCSHTISKSIAHEDYSDVHETIRDYDNINDYVPRYARHTKPRKEEKIHKITKQIHMKQHNSDSLTEPPNSPAVKSTAKIASKKSLRRFNSLWRNLKSKKSGTEAVTPKIGADSKSRYGTNRLESFRSKATSKQTHVKEKKKQSKLNLIKRKREVAYTGTTHGPTAFNFGTIKPNYQDPKSGQLSLSTKPAYQSQPEMNNLVNVNGKTVYVISELDKANAANNSLKINPETVTSANRLSLAAQLSSTTEEGDNTGRIEDLLNSIKAKVVEILTDHSSQLHESNMISNAVTVTTFKMEPSLFVGFTSQPLTTERINNNVKKINFNLKSLSGDDKHAVQARCCKDLKDLKGMCQKVIHKVSEDFKNEVKETAKALKSITHCPHTKPTTTTSTKTLCYSDKSKSSTTKKKDSAKCIVESGLIESPKSSTLRASLSPSTKMTSGHTSRNTKQVGKKVRQANETISRIWKNVLSRYRPNHNTSPRVDDDYILLSLYEQMLTTPDQMRGGKTAPVKRSYNSEKALLSKRNIETLTDLNLKENIQDIYNDGEVMPEVAEVGNQVKQKDTNESSILNDGRQFQMDSEPEDITIEGLSDKLSYKDYINGFKYYLKFQKELKNENFSDLIKYQAHRHHNVDDIGKYILEKLPQVPNINRNKRRFFDDDTMDDQDISTRSDDSWFKKHFYFFIDNGPPKKFHTSQTVPLKSHAKSTTNVFDDEFSGTGSFNTKKHKRKIRSPESKMTNIHSVDTRNAKRDDLLALLNRVSLEKTGDKEYIFNPTLGNTNRTTETTLATRSKRYKNVTTPLETDNDKNPCDNDTFSECGETKNDKPIQDANKDKPQEKADGIMISNCKKLVRVRHPKSKPGKLKSLLNKFNLFKRNKKVKRSYSKPQRFNALKHLKNIFLGDSEAKMTPDPEFPYQNLDKQLSMYKLPNVESLYNQIPNITDVDNHVPNSDTNIKLPTITDSPILVPTLNEQMWTPKFKFDPTPLKTTSTTTLIYKKPRPKQFYPMSRFVTSAKGKDLKKMHEDYYVEDAEARYSENPLPRMLFHFHSKHPRTKVPKTPGNVGMGLFHDFLVFNTKDFTAKHVFEKHYRTTDTKSTEKETKKENKERFNIKKLSKEINDNFYPDYFEEKSSPILESEPLLRMFELPNAALSPRKSKNDVSNRNNRRIKLKLFRKQQIKEKNKPLKDSTKKLYEVSRTLPDDEENDDFISEMPSVQTTESTTTSADNTHNPHVDNLYTKKKLTPRTRIHEITHLDSKNKQFKSKLSFNNFDKPSKESSKLPFKKINKETLKEGPEEQPKEPYKDVTSDLSFEPYKTDDIQSNNSDVYDFPFSISDISADDVYPTPPEDLPIDFEDFYIMNSDILQFSSKQPTWQAVVKEATKNKFVDTTPDPKKMLKEVDDMTDQINVDFGINTEPVPEFHHKPQKPEHRGKSSGKPKNPHHKIRPNVKVIHYTFVVHDTPTAGFKRLAGKHNQDVTPNMKSDQDAASDVFGADEVDELRNKMREDSNGRATAMFDSEMTKNNFQTSNAKLNKMLIDTTLLAYDDGADVLTTEMDPLPFGKVAKSSVKTNRNTPPKQFFSTPIPMKYNEFENFLKENDLDLFSLTSPLENVPRLHSFDLKHRLYANPTKIIKMDRQLSKDSQRADVNTLASKTDKIKKFFHLTTATNNTSNLTEMSKITLFRDISTQAGKGAYKRNKFDLHNPISFANLDQFESTIEDDVFNVVRTVANKSEKPVGSKLKFKSTHALQNPIEEISERSPTKGTTKVKKLPEKAKHVRYKTYKKPNQRVLYPLPLTDHRMITREESNADTHNILLFNEGQTHYLNSPTVTTKELDIPEISYPDHEFTTFYSHHGPAEKVETGKQPHSKQVLYSNHVCKFDVLSNKDNSRKPWNLANENTNLERPNYNVPNITDPDSTLAVLDYTTPNVIIHIDLPTYYLPITDPYQNNIVLPKKLSWHDHIVRCLSGLALVELLSKYGFIKTIDVPHDKNLNCSKVFSESHAKRYMEVTPEYLSEAERHGRYLKNDSKRVFIIRRHHPRNTVSADLFKRLQESSSTSSQEVGRTVSRSVSTLTFFGIGESPEVNDDLLDEKTTRSVTAAPAKKESVSMEYDSDYYGEYKGIELQPSVLISEVPIAMAVANATESARNEKKKNPEAEEPVEINGDDDDDDEDEMIGDISETTYDPEPRDSINVNFEKIVIEKGFKIFSKKRKNPPITIPPLYRTHDLSKHSKKTSYYNIKTQDPYVYIQETPHKTTLLSKKSSDINDMHKELEQIFNLHQEVLAKIKYLRNKFHSLQSFVSSSIAGTTPNGRILGKREKREKKLRKNKKRDANTQTYTAKDVSALEVVVDLVKDMEPESQDSKSVSTRSFKDVDLQLKNDYDRYPNGNSSLQLHIYVPNEFRDAKKRGSDNDQSNVRVRKVFSAIMSTPVDIEYQIRSYVDDTVTVTTVPAVIENHKYKTEQTINLSPVDKSKWKTKQIPVSSSVAEVKWTTDETETNDERETWKNEKTMAINPARNYKNKWKTEQTTTSSTLTSTPSTSSTAFSTPEQRLISTELSLTDHIVDSVKAYTLTTPSRIFTLAITGASFPSSVITALQNDEDAPIAEKPTINEYQHITPRNAPLITQPKLYTLFTALTRSGIAKYVSSDQKRTANSPSPRDTNEEKSTMEPSEQATVQATTVLPTFLHVSISDPKVLIDSGLSPATSLDQNEPMSSSQEMSMNVMVTLSPSTLFETTATSKPNFDLIKHGYATTFGPSNYVRRSFSEESFNSFSKETKMLDLNDLVKATQTIENPKYKNTDANKHINYDDLKEIMEATDTETGETTKTTNYEFSKTVDASGLENIRETTKPYEFFSTTNLISLDTSDEDNEKSKITERTPTVAAEELPSNVTTNKPLSSGRVTLSKEFIAAVDDRVIQLFLNLTRLQNRGLIPFVKEHNHADYIQFNNNQIDWDSVKKVFKREAGCHCKYKNNLRKCRSCPASDAVMVALVAEFDNLARFLNDHCSEVQEYLKKNPLGTRRLREVIQSIDKTIHEYDGAQNVQFHNIQQSDNHDVNERQTADNFPSQNCSSCLNFQKLFALSNNLNKAMALNICPSKNLTKSAKNFYNQAKCCLATGPANSNDSSNDSVKNVYSLDKINVNIICKPTESSTGSEIADSKEPEFESISDLEAVDVTASTYPSKKKGKRIKNLFFFKSGNSKRKHNKSFTRNYIARDSDFWIPVAKSKMKRNANANDQLESPLITDTGGSFWNEYLKNDNKNSGHSARNFISEHSPKLKKRLFKSRVRDLHTTTTQRTSSFLDILTTELTEVTPNANAAPQTFYNVNIFGTVNSEHSDVTDDCHCQHSKSKTKLNEKTTQLKSETRITTKRASKKESKCTRKPKTTHAITTKTTLQSSKIEAKKKEKKWKKNKSTKSTRSTPTSTKYTSTAKFTPTSTASIPDISSEPEFSITELPPKEKESALTKTTKSIKMWQKIISTLDFYRKHYKGSLNDNEFNYQDSTNAFNFDEAVHNDQAIEPESKDEQGRSSNLLLSIYLYKKRKADDWMSQSTESPSTVNNHLSFNTTELAKQSAKMVIDNLTNNIKTTTPEPMKHSLATLYPEMRALLDKIKTIRKKVVPGTKENDTALKKRSKDRSRISKVGTEEPDPFLTPRAVCDLRATYRHILRTYTSVPLDEFQKNIKNITCVQMKRVPRNFIIKLGTPPFARERNITQLKRTVKWSWIRRRRSADAHSKKERAGVRQRIHDKDKDGRKWRDFEEFFKDELGVYRFKYNGRRKRQMQDSGLKEESGNTQDMSLNDEIFVHLGDTLVVNCVPNVTFSKQSKKRQKPLWDMSSELMRAANILATGNTLSVTNVQPENDGEYYCKNDGIHKRVKLTIITLPNVNLVFIPVYSSYNECEDIKKNFIALDTLAWDLSQYLCPSNSQCTVTLNEPFCVRDTRFNRAHVQATAVVTLSPSHVSCDVECRKALLCALSSLSAKNLQPMFEVPVIISNGDRNMTLDPALRLEMDGFWRHSLVPRPGNAKNARFGSYELAKKANEYIMKATSNLEPRHVTVLPACSAGYYLVPSRSVCAACPRNSTSNPGQNVCVWTRGGAVGGAGGRRRRAWPFHGTSILRITLYILIACTLIACLAARGRGRERCARETANTLRRSVMEIDARRVVSAKRSQRPLSPSRVILSRLFNSPRRREQAKNAQEDKFKMWKLQNSRPPVPPVDFDW